MPYGIIKVDTITFTDAGVDKSIQISGLVQNPTFSGNVTCTGTISGVTVTGTVGAFTTVSGITVTGTTANFTSGNFTNISGGTYTITSGVFAAGSAASPSISFTGDSNTGLYSPGADQVAISTNGTQRLFVGSTGGIGIGTDSIGALVDVVRAQNSSTSLRVINVDAGASADSRLTVNNGTNEGGLIYRGTGHPSASHLVVFNNSTTQPITFLTSGSERLRITSDGKLGLGTSSPNSLFTAANGSIETNRTFYNRLASSVAVADRGLLFEIDGTQYGRVYAPNGKSVAIQAGAGTLTDALTVDQSGRVGIGTTSPGALLSLDNSTVSDIRLSVAGTLQANVYASSSDVNVFAVQANPVRFGTSNTERARLTADGKLLVGTSTSLGGTGSIKLEVGNGNSLTSSFAANAFANSYQFVKSRSASALGTIVQNGDEVGNIDWFGDDGTSTPRQAARIQVFVDGTPGASDMPGRLVFSTTADGASSPTERMRIAQNGVVTIQNGAVAVIGTLTDGATITPDLAADCNFTVTLGGARTIANPTNITAGQSGSILLVQDGTGGRTASWGSYWDFPGGTAPTLSTAANAVDRVDYIVRSSTSIHTVFTANYS